MSHTVQKINDILHGMTYHERHFINPNHRPPPAFHESRDHANAPIVVRDPPSFIFGRPDRLFLSLPSRPVQAGDSCSYFLLLDQSQARPGRQVQLFLPTLFVTVIQLFSPPIFTFARDFAEPLVHFTTLRTIRGHEDRVWQFPGVQKRHRWLYDTLTFVLVLRCP